MQCFCATCEVGPEFQEEINIYPISQPVIKGVPYMVVQGGRCGVSLCLSGRCRLEPCICTHGRTPQIHHYVCQRFRSLASKNQKTEKALLLVCLHRTRHLNRWQSRLVAFSCLVCLLTSLTFGADNFWEISICSFLKF